MRVAMLPHISHFRGEESGIKRVVSAYFRYLPQYGVELVDPSASYDMLAGHAGMAPETDVCHCHGLYWTADYPASQWEWKANQSVIASARAAKVVTVPSEWVAETFMRDMRFKPQVVPHGIEWAEWQEPCEQSDYVLWNKNRTGDVCDPEPLMELARRFRRGRFVSTFVGKNNVPSNIQVTGVIPHDQMKLLVKSAMVYLATTKETFGIGTLEAMAAGIPVLGFAHGGILDMVQHGVNGYLAKPGDIDDLVEGLNYCVKYRDVLGANGRELARAFTWEAVAEQVASIYRDALVESLATAAIIIPSYKYAEKVGGAIKSAVEQDYPLLRQIIVVDDGSDDGGATRGVVEEWATKDPRVRYVWQSNAGVANARNRGIAEVPNAKYVCCLDADDAIGPKFLSTCIRALEQNRKLGIAYTGLYYRTPSGDEGLSPWPSQFNYDDQLQGKNQIPTCCVFRREMWKRLGGYRQRYAPSGAGEEDAEFWLRAGAYGWDARMVGTAIEFQKTYNDIKRAMGRPPTEKDIAAHGIKTSYWNGLLDECFHYSWQSGRVSGDKKHAVTDWRGMHPWVKDGLHPFASMATPQNHAHAVRQYDQPTISVVIPVGPGHESLLINALDSLESQTFRKWEAVVIWDSKEKVPDLVADAYPYVRWNFTGGETGAGNARNIGGYDARGPLLLFLDADDALRPDALAVLLAAFEERGTNVAVYSDYIGKSVVDDPSRLAHNLQSRIYHYDEKTHLATIGYKALDYECEKAQQQPDGVYPYLWCNITTLFPRAWFVEAGGFDEAMPTWEDVDFWWRLARMGKCFVKVAEELLVYSFHTGSRRDLGVGMHADVIAYLNDKYKGVEKMPCGSCGGRRASSTPASVPQVNPQSKTVTFAASMNDEDWVLCTYQSPNRGDHQVYGAAVFPNQLVGIPMVKTRQGYRINYHYHGGGERFLVHKADIQAAGNLFSPVRDAIRVEEPTKPKPPEPSPIAPADDGLPDDYSPGKLEPVIAGKTIELKAPDPLETSDDPFDLQRLPGVGATIAQNMRVAGIESLQDILNAGEDGLAAIDGIGKARARVIIGALRRFTEERDAFA